MNFISEDMSQRLNDEVKILVIGFVSDFRRKKYFHEQLLNCF